MIGSQILVCDVHDTDSDQIGFWDDQDKIKTVCCVVNNDKILSQDN